VVTVTQCRRRCRACGGVRHDTELTLLAVAVVGFALVRWTSVSAILASTIGLVAAVGTWIYIRLVVSDRWIDEVDLWLTVWAIVLGTMFAAWLVGVVIGALTRPQRSQK
jgi:hypothetical protein